MMLNKQFLALAFAAGATFLVGCEDDDAGDAGECAGFKADEALPTSGECFDCLIAGVTPAPATITPLAATKAAVDKWNGCEVPFTDFCAGMDKITEASKVANQAAGQDEITAADDNDKFDANDDKNGIQAASCLSCFNAHFVASTETGDDKKATDAFKKCGVEVEIPA